jgi:hypothetical protein
VFRSFFRHFSEIFGDSAKIADDFVFSKSFGSQKAKRLGAAMTTGDDSSDAFHDEFGSEDDSFESESESEFESDASFWEESDNEDDDDGEQAQAQRAKIGLFTGRALLCD